ncbi:N-acetyltransferase [Streptomyces sp. NPDC014684]|uniref:N-acetyltransferase n=1 Tax=Streptomyces sp. NPDC014684 TaxID=3364880 RepID=UPI0036FA74D7
MNGAYGGQGIGGPLARFSLDAARAAGFSVLPVCPFSLGWIARTQDTEIRDITWLENATRNHLIRLEYTGIRMERSTCVVICG